MLSSSNIINWWLNKITNKVIKKYSQDTNELGFFFKKSLLNNKLISYLSFVLSLSLANFHQLQFLVFIHHDYNDKCWVFLVRHCCLTNRWIKWYSSHCGVRVTPSPCSKIQTNVCLFFHFIETNICLSIHLVVWERSHQKYHRCVKEELVFRFRHHGGCGLLLYSLRVGCRGYNMVKMRMWS